MILQVDPAWSGPAGIRGRRRRLRDVDLVVNHNAVMKDGHVGTGFFAAGIDAAGMERDVIRLPLRWRCTHIDQGPRDLVDAAALIVQTFKTVAIQYLHLISPLEVHAAVAPSLAACVGHKRCAKFQVQLDVGEFLFRNNGTRPRSDLHRAILK